MPAPAAILMASRQVQQSGPGSLIDYENKPYVEIRNDFVGGLAKPISTSIINREYSKYLHTNLPFNHPATTSLSPDFQN